MGKAPDVLGDRMKLYEMAEAGRKAMPGLPLLARLDGRAFHSFTRGLQRPYDYGMMQAMVSTTAALIEEFHPSIGYTQSDEITLAWHIPPEAAMVRQLPFDGRFQKLTSVLAGFASAAFTKLLPKYLPSKADLLPTFDCRVWQVPTIKEATDVFRWREADATKNSITLAAGAFYSHAELQGVGSSRKLDMLHAKGVNWNDYPTSFKRGSYLQRRTVEVGIAEDERLRIPEAHRPAAGSKVLRPRVEVLEIPPIKSLPNAEAVLFPPKEE